MGEPLTALGDGATDRSVLVETRRRVAGLSPALLRALDEARAGRRELVLLSAVDTRVTHPLAVLLREPGTRWVVRDAQRASDGITGAELVWDGAAFTPTGAPPPLVPPGPAGPGALEVAVEALSPATRDLRLGATTEALAAALGVPLAGWGPAEPVTRPWSAAEVTAGVRRRMPRPSSVVVVGGGRLTGLLAVSRVRTGVLERLSALAPLPAGPDDAALTASAAALARAGARSALFSWQPGSDGTRSGRLQPVPVPLGAMVTESSGAPGVLRRAGGLELTPLEGTADGVWARFGALAHRDLARFTAALAGEGRSGPDETAP
ncbi:DUF6177 family protein [Blastococcus sp. SYSU D00813]